MAPNMILLQIEEGLPHGRGVVDSPWAELVCLISPRLLLWCDQWVENLIVPLHLISVAARFNPGMTEPRFAGE